jgi:hypothetical protein
MKKLESLRNSIILLVALGGTAFIFAGCDLITPASDPQFKVAWVGLHGMQPSPPTSMYQLDDMAVYNQGGCTSESPDESRKLVWDGNSFSVSYTLTCQGGSSTSVRVVNLSGKLSANQKTLETFTGTVKYTYTSDDLVDYQEFYLAVKDVPLDGDEVVLSGVVEDDLTDHVVNAYWIWNTTEDGKTTSRGNSTINYINPRIDLTVAFYGAW